ncbi:PA14 domain-containing protein [Lutimaribacter pacificus]|uniref:PA14 domain-containing protein n=1 Tax=Lutimaribacter pacificus TaxID=391948 RepID=A0A1H0CL62_9RHOB|nr:PA14 domain-containing protein [Lutimaribacter pacificus]SDN58626.1 PA14 domain-containing protein [Lutimaribacter pacificus]SHJ43327.1 PA14 domain-containing protein [Lutimaribacter pacificus]
MKSLAGKKLMQMFTLDDLFQDDERESHGHTFGDRFNAYLQALRDDLVLPDDTNSDEPAMVAPEDEAEDQGTGTDQTDPMDDGSGDHIVASGDDNGLRASFFALESRTRSLADIDFDATPDATMVVGALDYGMTNEAFWEKGAINKFAAQYQGFLNVETAGSYTFYLTSDDGSALYLDGEMIIDNDGAHSATLQTVTLNLDAGAHEIEIRYFDNFREQVLTLEWEGPDSGGERQVIGGDSFTLDAPAGDDTLVGSEGDDTIDGGMDMGDEHGDHGDMGSDDGTDTGDDHSDHGDMDGDFESGLRATFFALDARTRSLADIDFDATPDATSVVGALDYGKSQDPFWEDGAIDKFAAQYQGFLNVSNAGSYTFYLTSDDGSALYLDGQLVIDNDGAHSATLQTITLDLESGAHEIEIRYFDNLREQVLTLEWDGPDSGGERQVIGGDSFAHEAPAGEDSMVGSEGDDTVDSGMDMGGDDGGMDMGDDHGDHGDTDMGDGQGDMDHGDTDMGDGGDMDHGDHDDTDMGGDHGDMDHGDHDDAGPAQPTTPDEEDAFVAAVMAEPDTGGHMAHMDNPTKATEHGQLLDLVPRSEATHVAVRDGDWFDPDTWYQGRIPDEGAKVLIPKGVSVNYAGESDESLFTVRVDGELSFATDTDSKLLVDTMVISTSGRLEIGTEDNPVQDHVNVEIVIANNGDIDVDWDPTLLSRGVISHGEAEIHGAEKTAYTKFADAPMAGDTEIRLAEIPDNWSVGDTIVVTGTHKTGWTWNSEERAKEHIESQDEELVIVSIDGDTITVDRPLQYDHDAPREDLSGYVANMTRNITFSSEDGDATEIHHRGHVMFMHSDNVDVRYAAFDDLGRTDKSEPAFLVETLDLSTIEADTNIQGRYSFHLHKTGTEDQDNPAISFGNTVSGSPGWGYVHHDSHAEFVQNIAFDVFGAAFVAESGNETGLWWENMAIKSEGIGYGHAKTKASDGVERDDVGRTGDGFFFAGRAVESGHNVAANTTHGYVWMTRAADLVPETDQLDHPDAYYGRDTARGTSQTPIQGFHDNEAFGTQVGLIVVKATGWQGHDVRTVMDGFTNWETSNGVEMTYTGHYTFKDFDLLGTTNTDTIANAKIGFDFSQMSFDLVVNGIRIEGFDTAIDFDQRERSHWDTDDVSHVVIDAELIGNETDFEGFDPEKHMIMTSEDLVEGRLEFVIDSDTTIGMWENLYLNGIKIDSIGEHDRQFADDTHVLDFRKNILPMLERDGYFETGDGERVMLVNDFIADRATGELLKMVHVVTLDFPESELTKRGIVNNGLINLDSLAPVTQDDFVSTPMEAPIVIDVLANDMDPEGGMLQIDGFTNPFHGDLSLQDDGTLLFSPHENKVGVESFDYWVSDGDGVLSKGTVFIDIFDA